MYRLITRVFLVTAVAGTALIGLAFPAAATTANGPIIRARPPLEVWGTALAGWRTSSTIAHGPSYWRFRYIATTVTIPSCPGPILDRVEATIGLQGFSENNFAVAIGIPCAAAGISTAHFDWLLPSGSGDRQFGVVLHAGDTVTMNIFFDRNPASENSEVRMSVTDVTTGDSETRGEGIAGNVIANVFFRHAGWLSVIDGANAPLSADTEVGTTLWTFRNCRVTSDPTAEHPTAVKRGIFGPWPINWEIVTRDGAPAAGNNKLVLYPEYPSTHSPANFEMVLAGPNF